MQEFLNKLIDVGVPAVGKILLALVVFIVGKIIISALIKKLQKGKKFQSLDPTLYRFTTNFIKIALYTLLVIAVISILGIPMASVIAVLASAGLTIGLALQGALTNFAGGIMLLIFRPFNVGDYISAAGGDGFVKTIALFYTVINTIDNKTITIPNGSLMNSNITNFTREGKRRVDLVFSCAKSENVADIQQKMVDVMMAHEKVLKDPAPFARLSGGTDTAMEFTLRAWCETADYWDVYFDMNQQVVEAFAAAGVKAPTVRVMTKEE